MIEETVKIIKDNGVTRRWGIKSIYSYIDGEKTRVDSRAVMITCLVFFGVSSVISLSHAPKDDVMQRQSKITAGHITDTAEKITLPDSISTNANTQNSAKSKSAGIEKDSSTFELEIIRPKGNLIIPMGTIAKAKLVSGASNGPIRAELLEDIKVNGSVSVKSGALLIGDGESSEGRLIIKFSHLVLKDGTARQITAQALDSEDKTPGVKGSDMSGRSLGLLGAIGLNFTGGMAMGLQEREQSQKDDRKPKTAKDALLSGAAVAALDHARDLSEVVKDEKPLVEVEAGTVFYLLFLGDGI